MENIKLSQLVDAILAFKHSPSDENEAKINGILGQLQIVPYLSLTKKMIAATSICINIWDDNKDAIQSGITLEVNELLIGLLAYAINLENDMYTLHLPETIYDILCEYGVDDYLLKFCAKDFKRLQKLIDKIYNFGNVYRIEQTAELFTPDSLATFASTLKETVSSLTPEMIADLKSISNAELPEWQALKETIIDEAVDQTLYSDLNKSVKDVSNLSDTKSEQK